MNYLLQLNYWFDMRPEMLAANVQQIWLAGLIALVVLGVVSFVIKMRSGIYRGLFKRLYSFSLANLAIGLLLWFFNYESVPFFAARFWLGLWLIIMLMWLVFIAKGLKAIFQQKQERSLEEEKKKYLP